MSEIPFTTKLFLTREIALAAACMADHRIPRLDAKGIAVTVDGENREVQFAFPDNPDTERVFDVWRQMEQGGVAVCPVGKIYLAFHYWNQFVNITQQERLNPRPTAIPNGFTWTENTKLPATALALLDGQPWPYDRLKRLVYRNGRVCGYFVKKGNLTEAYADPENWVADHPDDDLSYLVASFYQRDHLRDLAKQMPARQRFTDKDGSIYLIPTNQDPKEIPCLTQ